MIVQWRYKVCKIFALHDGEVLIGERLKKYRGGNGKPRGMFIHKPTKRKYDYVDYTGRILKTDLEFCEETCILELLGYIKFVESSNGK